MPDEIEIGDDIPDGPVAVYRFYAIDNTLLYIGVTDDLRQRLDRHRQQKPWWPTVARKTVAWYDKRKDAEVAEATGIADEHPLHNVRSHALLLGRQRVSRDALKVDVPTDLRLVRRLHSYRLDHGVDIRDQVAVAVDQWLTDRGY